MKNFISILTISILSVSVLTGCVTSSPKEPHGTKRVIPLSLWTGFDEGETSTTHYPQGDPAIKLEGPMQWENPETGEMITVYKRSRYSKRKGGHLVQYFRIRDDGQGIGRVWESHRNRVMTNNIKFPLGEWYQGEVRSLETYDGPMTITIRDINYGGDGGIYYTWRAYDECWVYWFRPGRGLTQAGRESVKTCVQVK